MFFDPRQVKLEISNKKSIRKSKVNNTLFSNLNEYSISLIIEKMQIIFLMTYHHTT